MDTPGLCTEMPDLSCICEIGRTNPIDLALVFLGIPTVSFVSAFFASLVYERETYLHFPPFSEGVLHSGMGCSGAKGNMQCFWRKRLDFAQNNSIFIGQ